MCRASDALRRAIGIHAYTPSVPLKALVRKSIWHNARDNGHGPGVRVPPDPVVERLAMEHRIIRQIIEDARRVRCRGHGA
jgi:hypothetical protein